jgi:beta-mannosidase
VGQDELDMSTVVLVFEGLDTVATVFLNGVAVGKSDNSFVRYVLHVKDFLKVRAISHF